MRTDRTPARDLIAAEWIKLSTIRSHRVVAALGLASCVTVTLLLSRSTINGWDRLTPGEQADFDPLPASFGGHALLQLAVMLLSALAMSTEYSSGLVRTTFTAVPARRAVVAAKAAVVGTVALVLGLTGALGGFWISQALFSTRHVGLSLTDPGALRAVTASALHQVAAALIGLALGALIRHGAGALTACFAFLFVSPLFLHGEHGVMLRVQQSLLGSSLHHLTINHPDPHGPSATAAWASMLLQPLLALALALLVVHRREV
ncbi:hypothetical protein ACFVUH_07945 [Kitasatospora sp. NPDC058032]|uniref:hypothetical protein n=1 Tax=Kitasatospora sp. NPDC058032 TaxID=3346307 RepID=UPI0036DAE567